MTECIEESEDWKLKQGPEYLCLDAMVLIAWNQAGELDLLGQILGEAYTAHVIIHQEIMPSLGNYPENQRIVDAEWLIPAPVREEDGQEVSDLLRIWESEPGKDRGEAEIVVLSKRHGWTAITDDNDGRGALGFKGLKYGYGATMLLSAVAHGRISEDEAWRVHQTVEGTLAKPHVLNEKQFRALMVGAKALAEKGQTFEQLAGSMKIDQYIDRFDGRSVIRWR